MMDAFCQTMVNLHKSVTTLGTLSLLFCTVNADPDPGQKNHQIFQKVKNTFNFQV